MAHSSTDSVRESGGVASVERALTILNAFRKGDRWLSLADLSQRTSLYKSTLLRLADTLIAYGYLRRNDAGLYAIGSAPARLAMLYQDSFELRDMLMPVLQFMMSDSGETASFYVREGGNRICLYRQEPDRTVRLHLTEGQHFPLSSGAAGKILRAFGNPAEDAGTPELVQVREQGYALSLAERDPDAAAIAAPLFNTQDTLLGALTISGPLSRFSSTAIDHHRETLRTALSQLGRLPVNEAG